MVLLGLDRGQLLARRDRDAAKGKEGEIGMETFGHSATEAVPIQTTYGYQL